MVVLLDKSEIWFPDPCLAEPDGLLAIGGQLTVPWLLAAYSVVVFSLGRQTQLLGGVQIRVRLLNWTSSMYLEAYAEC